MKKEISVKVSQELHDKLRLIAGGSGMSIKRKLDELLMPVVDKEVLELRDRLTRETRSAA